MKFKKDEKKVFTVSQKHRRTRRTIFFLEALIVLATVVGTLIIFIKPGDFSLKSLYKTLEQKVRVQKPQTAGEAASFEDSIKTSIDGKLLSVVFIKKSPEGFYTVDSKEGTKVIVVENKNLSDQIKTLQTVLSKAKIEKKKAVLVDFRFEKLVVRYDR